MNPAHPPLKAMLIRQGQRPGSQVRTPWDSPDLTAGNAQFLDSDPKRFVQLRPVLTHEQAPGRFFGLSDQGTG